MVHAAATAEAASARAINPEKILEVVGDILGIDQLRNSIVEIAKGTISSGYCSTTFEAAAAATEKKICSRDEINALATDWNVKYAQEGNTHSGWRAQVVLLPGTHYYCISFVPSYMDTFNQTCLTTQSGLPIVCTRSEYDMPTTTGQWLPFYGGYGNGVRMTDRERLEEIADEAGGYTVRYKDYRVISSLDGEYGWFDHNGVRWAAWLDTDDSATGTNRPVDTIKDETGAPAVGADGTALQDTLRGSNVNINLEGMTVTLPDGSINMIDQLVYDESNKTYYIDSHDITNNTVNNYYSWTYHINYTSITYIGQSEEYTKHYEVYYQLPDGRSSADLTAEELEQLNLAVDVVPYGRSADDTSLRSLYHFDGDTQDSSYWNYMTDFEWNTGASLTYMEAGAFEGALYLDENEHEFTITLPSNLGIGDYTLQFRYYQSHTEAPVTDSYVKVGSITRFQFNGSSILSVNGALLSVLPTGTWNEIALVKHGNSVYWYLNGLCICTAPTTTILNNQIVFHFGSEQQTYKYLDELRVLNRAICTGGESYTPTSVPHDTNLTLVLPDSVLPVADEYWEITHNDGTHLAEDYTENRELISGVVTGLEKMTTADGVAVSPTVAANQATHITRYNKILDGSSTISTAFKLLEYPLPVTGHNDYFGVIATVSVDGRIYEVSGVVKSGGDYGFWLPSGTDEFACTNLTRIDNGIMGFAYDNLCIAVDPSSAGFTLQAVDIVMSDAYSTLADAQSFIDTYTNQFNTEKVSSIIGIEKAEMNTPTLAVRTDIVITNYQIGGVRPSVPYKGLVWALVESGYITSIQIYNGQAWESCDGRVWTGERWIPFGSYNVVTLQNVLDIVDGTPNFEYIYTEEGFWAWWQKSWNDFVTRYFEASESAV